MRRARSALALGIGAHVFAVATAALAQQPAATDHAAVAEDLFRRAMPLMGEKRYGEACPLLAESHRIDPGGGTLQNLAVCYESAGRWASAYARFEELRVVSKSSVPPRLDRVTLAEEHLQRVTPRVSRVIVVVQDDARERTEVKIDEVVYRPASWSTGIAVDPGAHAIIVEAPGKRAWRTSITTPTEGGEQRLTVPRLDDASPETPSRAAETREVVRPAAEQDAREREATARRLRTAGWVVGGAGVAAFAAGGVFGVLTIMRNAAGKDACRIDGGSGAPSTDFAPNGRCYEGRGAWRTANDAKDSAETFANVANVLVPLGVVATVVGAWLVLANPKPPQPSTSRVRIAPWLGSAALEGQF